MQYDPENPVVKLCAQGIDLETKGNTAEAHALYQQAWQTAANDVEAFTAAHYLARTQPTLPLNLEWNLKALEIARRISDGTVDTALPSLYLNVGKAYEDLGDPASARLHYREGKQYAARLPESPYSTMIKGGLDAGLERVREE